MKVIFLDRDGVINKYPGDFKYVTNWSDFKFLPGAKEALKKLNNAGYMIFIISNQAGVSKGIFTKVSLDKITKHMLKEFKVAGVKISGVYYCTHREEDNCSCRKPKTGLIDTALKSLHIQGPIAQQANNYFLVGDTMRDIQTGRAAECKTILVFSGKESLKNKDNWTHQPDFIAKDLSEAMDLILNV